MSTDLLTAWQGLAGEGFAGHIRDAWSYFSQTVGEVVSEQATWTITPHEGHAVLVVAGDAAFAVIAFSGPPDRVTIKGALHPLREGMVRVSFNDRLASEDVDVDGMERFTPMVRQWSFDWHGRLQLPLEYWLPRSWAPSAEAVMGSTVAHHERQRAMAHKLATAAGWPMPVEPVPDEPG